ncbi:MAG: transposase [Asticcacaulis sp.]|nr:transposase [Asticcacaulis sp.]MCR6658765.1 transposase [Asticcacaulis sp.]MCR6660023.1 transposase [Asticcacaulis sp.]MCR6660944.1 transposase [Asticcacaulis sp.]
MATSGIYVQRRTWSWQEKRQIVDEAFSGEASVSAVARRHGLQNHQIYRWRDGLAAERVNEAAGDFVAVTVTPEAGVALVPALSGPGKDTEAKTPKRASGCTKGMVEIVMPDGSLIRIPVSAGARFAADVVAAVSPRRL